MDNICRCISTSSYDADSKCCNCDGIEMEKKLSWGEVCKLMIIFEKYVSKFPISKDNPYEVICQLPLFLQENGYEIWKRN